MFAVKKEAILSNNQHLRKVHEARLTMNMEDIFGKTLLTDVKGASSPTKTVLKDKDLVLLYFSASWCPPCKAFTPVLDLFYNQFCVPNGVEIVFISSDQTMESFNEYYGKMPWKSLPAQDSAHIKQKLADSLKISGIPALVVLDAKTGFFINDNARNEVMLAADSEAKCKELIESWKKAEAMPIEEAKLSGSGRGGMIGYLISGLLRNPMYMVAIVYMFKKLMRKWEEFQEEGGVGEDL